MQSTTGQVTAAERPWIPMRESYADQPGHLHAMVNEIQAQLDQGVLAPPANRLTLLGIGASLAAAGTAVYVMQSRGLDVVRMDAGELPEGYLPPGQVIGISQSGRSSEVVAAMSRIEPVRSRAVTNYAPSPLQDVVGGCLNLGDLPDSSVSVASFTGTLLAFGLLTDHWLGTTELGHWSDVIDVGSTAASKNADTIARFAASLSTVRAVDVVSAAPAISVAEEAALMLREGPRVPATAMPTRQYLHGPMDSAGNTAHVVIGTEREAQLVEQLGDRADELLFVTPTSSSAPPAGAAVIEIDADPDRPIEFAIAATLVAQKLVLTAADHLGVDVDAPAFARLDTKVTGTAHADEANVAGAST